LGAGWVHKNFWDVWVRGGNFIEIFNLI